MRIFTEQPFMEFIHEHPETKTALQEWASVAKKSSWTSFEDIQSDFSNVSSIGEEQYNFGILGGRCQLIVAIRFSLQLISIHQLIHN